MLVVFFQMQRDKPYFKTYFYFVSVGCWLLKRKLRFLTESEQEVTHWLSALGTGRSCSLALRLEKDFNLFASGLSADMVGGRLEVDFLVFGG